jgi:hypothetical protein
MLMPPSANRAYARQGERLRQAGLNSAPDLTGAGTEALWNATSAPAASAATGRRSVAAYRAAQSTGPSRGPRATAADHQKAAAAPRPAYGSNTKGLKLSVLRSLVESSDSGLVRIRDVSRALDEVFAKG